MDLSCTSCQNCFLSHRSEHHWDDEKLRGTTWDQQQLGGRGDSRAVLRSDICRVWILSLQTAVCSLSRFLDPSPLHLWFFFVLFYIYWTFFIIISISIISIIIIVFILGPENLWKNPLSFSEHALSGQK